MSAVAGEVLRVWRGAAAPQDVPRYAEHFRSRVEPALRRLAGFQGAEVLTRPGGALVEIVVHTRWVSLDAVAAFVGPNLDAAVVDPEALGVLAEHDTFVRHFTVAHVT